jgi:hypothetical protein
VQKLDEGEESEVAGVSTDHQRDVLNVTRRAKPRRQDPKKVKKPGEPGSFPLDNQILEVRNSGADAHPSNVLNTLMDNDAASDVAFGFVVVIVT